MTRLGYTAYYPLPEAFFADQAAYNEAPIGNGPFMMDGTWEHDVEIRTVANPDFAGEDQAQIEGLTFKIYAEVDAAMNDLMAGNLDIVDALTPERAAEVMAAVPNSVSHRARRSTTWPSRCTTRHSRTRMCGLPCRWPLTGRRWSTARSSTGPVTRIQPTGPGHPRLPEDGL